MYGAGLFELLEKRRSGCWVEGDFQGIWGYSDNNWAMVPSLSALQDMILTMEEYALDTVKHLGITVTNDIDGCQKDMMLKRARYIARNSDILQ